MAGLEAGLGCVKTHGKEAGKTVVVLEFDKKTGFAVVVGPFVKKKKCNFRHLMPLGKTVAVKKNMDRKEIAEILK